MPIISYKTVPEKINEDHDGWGVHMVEVWLTLDTFSKDENDRILLCSSCVTEDDIEGKVKALQKQIHDAGQKAKKRMRTLKDHYGLNKD